MSVTLVEGFDTYNGTGSNTGLATRWTYSKFYNNDASQSLQAGRFTGQGLRLAHTYAATAAGGVTRTLPAAVTSIGVGFAYRSSAVTIHSTNIVPTIFGLRNVTEGVWHLLLAVTTSGAIAIYRASGANAGTLLGTSAAGVIRTSTYHYIEMGAVIDDSAGKVLVKVDGTQVLSLTAVDTRNGGTTATVDSIVLAANVSDSGTVNHDFDDLYVTDTFATLGERRVETLVPTSDVSKVFTPSTGSTNYSAVDELPNNGDTDYVSGTNVGDTDVYGFSDLSSTPTAVDAVQVVAYAQKTDAATRSLALQVKSGSTTSDGTAVSLAVGYSKFERLLTTDPATSAAWTASAVNALQGGPKVAA